METLEDVLAGPETEVMDAIQVATTAFVVVSPVITVKNGSRLAKTPPPSNGKIPTFSRFFCGSYKDGDNDKGNVEFMTIIVTWQ